MSSINFTIKLAGINIGVCVSFLSSKNFCVGYLTNNTPNIKISVDKQDLVNEAKKSAEKYSKNYLETLAIYRKIADALIDYSIVLMHGSAVCINGKCHILTGPSGAGKSTHAALLKRYAPESAKIINDDKPLIKISSAKCEVFGTPWDGSRRISENTSAPLKSICFIKQASKNEINEISKEEALPPLMPQVFKSEDSEKVSITLDLINKLMQNVNFYELKCTKDISAAELSYKTLNN